jgi:hypothetical protein
MQHQKKQQKQQEQQQQQQQQMPLHYNTRSDQHVADAAFMMCPLLRGAALFPSWARADTSSVQHWNNNTGANLLAAVQFGRQLPGDKLNEKVLKDTIKDQSSSLGTSISSPTA